MDDISAEWRRERPDIDHEAMALIGRLSRLSKHLGAEMAAVFEKHGLNGASFDLLATLRRAGHPYRLSPNALLDRTMVTSGTMTNRIDRLVTLGLAERVKNPNDARSVLIGLTPDGLTRINQAVTDHTANQTRLVAGLRDDERAALNALLTRFLEDFEG